MQDLLFKLGLTLELNTTRETFIKAFQKNVDPDQVDIFEIFSNSKNHYKGEITLDTFKIKKRVSFSTTNFGRGTATGNFLQRNDKLFVEAKITSVNGSVAVFYFLALVLAYGLGLVVLTISFIQDDQWPTFELWDIPFLFLHAAFMFGIPYLILRGTVKRMKYDLERDLYFMLRQ